MHQRSERKPKVPRYSSEELVFAEWLLQQLRISKLTGAELAERAGIAKASVYFYLDGSRIPSADAVAKLCAALRVDISTVPQFERRLVGRPAYRNIEAEINVR